MDFISVDKYYQLIILGILLLCLYIFKKPHKLNEPPLVQYIFPFIGHTIEYFTNTENFIKKCREQYGEIFSLYVFGRTITIVGKELSSEVIMNHRDFDFFEAISDTLPLSLLLGRPTTFFENLAKVVRNKLSGDIRQYTNGVQDALKISINKFIGESEEPNCIKSPRQIFLQIVARPVASVVVGEDLSNDDKLVNTFANLTRDIIPALSLPPVLNFIHPSLHTRIFVIRLKYTNHLYMKHRQLIISRIASVIERREHEKKELGESWKPPADILQSFIDLSYKDGLVDIEKVTDYIIDIIFAAIHTTSQAMSSVLYEYGARPEYWNELVEENEKISYEVKDGYLNSQNIANMVKLDSFVRETLRNWQPVVGLEHKTLNDHYTFSNGYQVPKGRNVYLHVMEIHNIDPVTNIFNGFQYVEKNSPSTKAARNYITFGLGRHACPGRFLAMHIIKISLYFLIKSYRIKTESGNIVKPAFAGSFALPIDEGLIFENKFCK